MVNLASKLSFYAALLISSVLAIMLLSAAASYGLTFVVASAPPEALVFAILLFNPVVFGLLGLWKGTPKWRFIAAGAMMTLPLLYMLAAGGPS